MLQGTSGFINVFQHVSSASDCHLQEVVGVLEANQEVSVLWACTDRYGIFYDNWPNLVGS
jgi:hypothetical protein